MGYSERTDGIANFSKAVFSFWFYIPSAVFTTLLAIDDTPPVDTYDSDTWNGRCFTPPLYKTLPLITFGSLEVATAESSVPDGACSPSFIGVDFGAGDPVLVVNLQMSNFGVPSGSAGLNPYRPDCFYMGGGNASPEGHQRTTIIPDAWHHALVSFDLSSGCSIAWGAEGAYTITPGPTFSWALNGVNKVGTSMYPSGDEEGGTSEIDIVPQSLFRYSGNDNGDAVDWSTTPIASDGNPIAFPASTEFASNIYNIAMAEVQVFTDVSVDAREEEVIRAFITATGHPASPSLAATLCGKSPEIYFRSAADVNSGTNRGTAGDFTKTGTIIDYPDGP